MCRKDLSVKSTPKTKSSLTTPLRQQLTTPYSSQLRTQVEEAGQPITYQEFIDIVAQSNSRQQNTVIEVRPTTQQQQPVTPKPISKSQKLLKIFLCLGILAAIAVVVIIVL
jgi:hypothetical protein